MLSIKCLSNAAFGCLSRFVRVLEIYWYVFWNVLTSSQTSLIRTTKVLPSKNQQEQQQEEKEPQLKPRIADQIQSCQRVWKPAQRESVAPPVLIAKRSIHVNMELLVPIFRVPNI